MLGSEAPQPEWGLPEGWGAYLADLFSWALDRPVSKDEAMRCARRQPGRSWETVDQELHNMGGWPKNYLVVVPVPYTGSE